MKALTCGGCRWAEFFTQASALGMCMADPDRNRGTSIARYSKPCRVYCPCDGEAAGCRFRREDSIYCHAMPLSEARLPECMGVWCKLAEA